MKHSTTKPDERTPMEKAIDYFKNDGHIYATHLSVAELLAKKFLPIEKEERKAMEETVNGLDEMVLKLTQENDKLKARLGIVPDREGIAID